MQWHSGDGNIIILEDHFGLFSIGDRIHTVPYLLTDDWHKALCHFSFPYLQWSSGSRWAIEAPSPSQSSLALCFRDSCCSPLPSFSFFPNTHSHGVYTRIFLLLLLPVAWLSPSIPHCWLEPISPSFLDIILGPPNDKALNKSVELILDGKRALYSTAQLDLRKPLHIEQNIIKGYSEHYILCVSETKFVFNLSALPMVKWVASFK